MCVALRVADPVAPTVVRNAVGVLAPLGVMLPVDLLLRELVIVLLVLGV